MQKEHHILMLDNGQEEALLAAQALREGGLSLRVIRVSNRADFEAELGHHRPDLVLADYGLPDFDGLAALAMLQAQCPEVPFLIVSGTLDEQTAAEALERGASGCVLRQHPATLRVMVKRTLERAEKAERLRRRAVELEQRVRELQTALARRENLRSLEVMCAECRRIRRSENDWVPLDQYFQEQSGVMISHTLCPTCARNLYPEVFQTSQENGR